MKINDQRSLLAIVILAIVIVLIAAVLFGQRQHAAITPAASESSSTAGHQPAG